MKPDFALNVLTATVSFCKFKWEGLNLFAVSSLKIINGFFVIIISSFQQFMSFISWMSH